MLKFNPFFRPTAEECLKNPYFNKVKQFSVVQNADKTVSFEFERKSFVSMVEIRQLMLKEVAYYQSMKDRGLSDLSPKVAKPDLQMFFSKDMVGSAKSPSTTTGT